MHLRAMNSDVKLLRWIDFLEPSHDGHGSMLNPPQIRQVLMDSRHLNRKWIWSKLGKWKIRRCRDSFKVDTTVVLKKSRFLGIRAVAVSSSQTLA